MSTAAYDSAKTEHSIILGTTRQGRFADKPVEWLLDLVRKRGDATFEPVDLRELRPIIRRAGGTTYGLQAD